VKLAGKAALVTGASRGLGRALALELAGRGARLALSARDLAALSESAEACRRAGAEVVTVPGDVGVPADCAALVDGAVARLGGLDLLLHVAGVTMSARLDEVSDLSLYETLLRVNYLGPVHLTRRALPHLVARRGAIVGVSSLAGRTGVPTRSGYAAAKHALEGFLASLRLELRAQGVSVLVVAPGFVDTGVRGRALGGDARPVGEAREDPRRALDAGDVARRIARAVERRQRDLVLPRAARAGLLLGCIAPGVVDAVTARAMAAARRR
jgi:NAD(P)-dependent dehydrogenase (short-subunit alcohol dehydrogenase family)